MDPKTTSLTQKIEKLRGLFLGNLPDRLTDAGKLLETLNSAEGEENRLELRRILHSIKGTGNSFGFNDLGAKILVCEQALDQRSSTLTDAFVDLLAYAATLPHPNTESREPEGICSGDEKARWTGEWHRNGRIYICDDDQAQADLIGNQLGYFGFRTRIFTDTENLREAMESDQPDVVVMDIMFPDGESEGPQVLAEIRKQNIEVPAVFISGRKDFEARILAIRAGGVAYYPKPVEAMDLVGTIDAIVHPPVTEPIRVLIVDDEEQTAQYHQAILEESGMQVFVVLEPETVLDAAAVFRPDLVLMDMYMPRCSGWEVAALIRQIPEFLSLPIIYLSAETNREKQLSALKVGAEDFLTKPIKPSELVSSVTLRAERMRTLHSLMTRDSLTGLFNHTTTSQLLENSLDAAVRNNLPLSFAMIDLDLFKAVNDTWGHPVGDQVLLAMARVLRQRLRNTDFVGRYGGEEFAVILNNAGLQAAADIMDSIREDFGKILFHSGDKTFSCTFSCGIAARTPGCRAETLRLQADQNLYKAKCSGRNRVVAVREVP